MGECFNDTDCPGTELCYSADYSWTGDESECGCSTWFGYVGDDCTEFGVGTYIVLLSCIITVSMSLLGVYFGIQTLGIVFKISQHCQSEKKQKPDESENALADPVTAEVKLNPAPTTSILPVAKKKKKKSKVQFNAMNTTSLFAFLAMLSFLAFRVIHTITLFTPTNSGFREESGIEGDAKSHKNEENAEPFAALVFGVFMSIAVPNLSLVWIDNVRKIQKFSVEEDRRVFRYKSFLVLLNVVWITLFLVLDPTDAAAVILILLIIGAVLYIMAVRYLKKLQKSFGDGSELSSNKNFWLDVIVHRMTACRRRIVIGTSISVVGGVLYIATGVTSHWRAFSPSGYPSPAMIGNELMIFGGGMVCFAVVYFLYESAAKPISEETKSRSRKATSF